MMRERPWLEPSVCGGWKRSRPTTRRPRRASARVAALPIAPRPATTTSAVRGTRRLYGRIRLETRREDAAIRLAARRSTMRKPDRGRQELTPPAADTDHAAPEAP